ncbi:MAG: sporulation protein YqfD [Oscillospiraceae bacterium]|nr:sporulation protein YqfD [Oscillospiraceae bacterium]
MILLRLFRGLRGFVRFSATGVFVERFLNLVARQRIPIWEVRRREYTLTGCVSASDYPRLRPLAKKAGVKLRLAEKRGAPFKKKKLRGRHGLLIGLAVFFVFLFSMTRFVWSIHIEGNETIPQEAILDALEEVGIRPGVLRSSMDIREAERLTLLAIREIGWIALNLDGSTIHVIVNEALPTPPVIDPGSPSNIVAARSGQLLEMRVYAGQPMFTAGDAVLEGEVIVSGITQDSVGQNLLRHARADVIAQVSEVVEIRVPLDQTRYERTGRTARRGYLRVFGFEAPMFFPREIERPYIIDRTETPWAVLGVDLPVSHRRESYILMQEIPFRYTEEQARARALRELETAEQAKFAAGEIIQRTLTGGLAEDVFILRGEYIAHVNIAKPQAILMGESETVDN